MGKIWNLQRQIWDFEFKKHSTLELREQIRIDRDRQMEQLDALSLEIEKSHKADTKKELENRLSQAKETVGRFESQMKMLDEEVNGVPFKSPEEPGRQGINDTLGSLAETKKMVENYLKTL